MPALRSSTTVRVNRANMHTSASPLCSMQQSTALSGTCNKDRVSHMALQQSAYSAQMQQQTITYKIKVNVLLQPIQKITYAGERKFLPPTVHR